MANLSGYIFLALAILLGITSNGFLKSTNGFTIIGPTIFCIISIVACIFCLSKAMNIIPVGFTYATYGGLTITAVTLFGVFKYQQIPNLYGIIGISLIIEAAKGIVSTWKNDDAKKAGNIICSANNNLHKKMLKILKPVSS